MIFEDKFKEIKKNNIDLCQIFPFENKSITF